MPHSVVKSSPRVSAESWDMTFPRPPPISALYYCVCVEITGSILGGSRVISLILIGYYVWWPGYFPVLSILLRDSTEFKSNVTGKTISLFKSGNTQFSHKPRVPLFAKETPWHRYKSGSKCIENIFMQVKRVDKSINIRFYKLQSVVKFVCNKC